MKRFYSLNLLIVATILIGSATKLSAQLTTFPYTGGQQTYTVGNGVTAIALDVQGACGGNNYSSWGGIGGKGGRVQATLAVSAGEVLYIYVGGRGLNGPSGTGTLLAGGFNGGGNSNYAYYGGSGGGGTDIRLTPGTITTAATGNTVQPYTTVNRLIVAGGGGASGAYCDCSQDLGGDGGGTIGGNGSTYGSTTSYIGYDGQGGTQSSGGASGTYYGQPIPYAGTIGVGGQSYPTYSYSAAGGGGYYGGGGSAYDGEGGGGSSYPATAGGGVSNITHTQGYNTNTSFTSGNGAVIICSPNLGSILGSSSVCTGLTTTLSATGSGGTWSSSNPTAATIDPSSGLVSGLASGVTVITYSATTVACGAGFITTTITVNPNPVAISGSPNVCLGLTTTLTDGSAGGTWSSSNITRATVGATTGTVNGLSLGTTTITYQVTASGCYTTSLVNINPLPSAITGSSTVCGGGSYTTTWGDASPGGTWTSGSLGNATIDPSLGIITGGTPGSSRITYTLPTGCLTTKTISINPLPSAITGTATVCAGATTTLSDVGGGTWSSSNIAIAGVGVTSGVVTGVTSGTANISYTLPTGCAISTSVFVNASPVAIAGVTNACVGATTALTDLSSGGTWSSSNPALAVVSPGSGVVTGISAGTPNITYTLSSTGCYITAPVVIDPLPAIYSITGGGGYCAGGSANHIGLGYSDAGINYKLYSGGVQVGSTVAGSNSGLDFGIFPTTGTYTAIGVNGTYGCTSSMSGSTVVAINTPPTPYAVGGGGSFCPGGTGLPVTLSSSDTGNLYQLYLGSASIGSPVVGTGSGLSFGIYTGVGSYTALATSSSTGCSQNMTGHASIANYPVPTAYPMNAGGGFCAGGTGVRVTLGGSDLATNYQLYNGTSTVGSPVAGSGSFIDFGAITTAGAYTVIATNPSTTCTQAMTGTSNVVINPLPTTYVVTGGGNYCAGSTGVHVGLNYSNTGITYQLFNGTSPVTSISGTNAGLDFGLQTGLGNYTVVATDASTLCTKSMTGLATVNTTPVPSLHTVTGTGAYCAGGSGVHVGLDGSNTGIRYQVYLSGTPSGGSMTGTGSALDFGLRATTGAYTVVATNVSTSCTNNMTGSATVIVNPVPTAYTTTGAGTSYCAGGTGIDVMLSGSDAGVTYQLYKGGAPVGSSMSGSGSSIDFGLLTAVGTYTVKGTITATGCISTMAGSAPISVTALPFAYALTGGGSYCDGGTGVHVGLTGSNLGVNYQLSSGSGPAGLPVAGTGGALDFGFETGAGTYTVTASDGTTGCGNNMTGASTITINSDPNAYSIIGGGNYCAGTGGRPVGLSNSDNGGITYQLYKDGTAVGSAVPGTGSSLSFGTFSAIGSYTAVARNPSTGCSTDMGTPVMIGVTALPTSYPVTGGGVYCSGGAGAEVDLNGSDAGVTYQLFYAGAPLDTAVAGTGTTLNMGVQTGAGSYTVIATSGTTGCVGNMAGSATITINAQPAVDTVTGGGSYCAGGAGVHVGLNTSSTGITYQLYNGSVPVGAAINGTGSSLDFGSLMGNGTYTIVASPGGLCATNMSGNAMVSINPLPSVFAITGGGAYCASASGVAVGLSSSTSGVNYQLFNGSATVGSLVSGTGSPLDFGLQSLTGVYTVVATDATTSCTSSMGGSRIAVTILPTPTPYNVTGGGSYCAGGSGVNVTLSNSNTNINYQLYMGTTAIGSLMAGTGTFIDFGSQTAAGTYTIVGTDASSLCTNNMNDAVDVTINPILTPVVSIIASPGLTILAGRADTLVAAAASAGTGATYQWFINSFAVPGATTNRLISSNFNNHDTVKCEVTSGSPCGGVTSAHSVVLNVYSNVGVQQMNSADANVSVVPNPNKGTFTITGSLGTNSNEEVSLELVDVLGHVVYTGKTVADNGRINEKVQISNTIANGMYILNMHSESFSKVLHVVIAQ